MYIHNIHSQWTFMTHALTCYQLASKQPLWLPIDTVDLTATRCPWTHPPQSLHALLYLKLGFSYRLSSLMKRHPCTHFNSSWLLLYRVPSIKYSVLFWIFKYSSTCSLTSNDGGPWPLRPLPGSANAYYWLMKTIVYVCDCAVDMLISM